ncbi:multisubunit sodium/proton antiporter, MrpA subunit [Saccharicrinis carchari]|uniref:Multisubunit sodium/proton antiporter, MrpA subunit n=1 Tax=Saccharicrinis carchari TaxID=1168039 RepID=A0A521AZ05_SACCC|nr:hydrogen gas-evolving membrane-bound hydrogenase subunit E [Saccharicrinis carchari]SMO40064.1 multisubunit sodium/proton antiporter, MrpA subunit [Saccharicrinis carchari]
MQYILLIYLLFALGIFVIPSRLKKHLGVILALIQAVFFVFFFSKISEATSIGGILIVIHWIPQLGLNLAFWLNGLSLVFALLITGIGTLVFLYASAYMKSYEGTDKFYFYLFLFAGAMLGLVLSANLIQLFVFWELTSFLSFLLISFFHKKELARKAAFQSLFITAIGGLLLLSGFLLLGSIVDSYSVADWLKSAQAIKSSKLYLPGLLLILAGAFTKSAQFPFHFWLPGAMQAPTPVSAYLHSATMVKAGVFLLALLNPVLGGTNEWIYIITLVGVITFFLGAYFSVTQTDLKAILAYTTISALGILVLLLGIDTTLSIKAAMLFLFVHAFYKAALFMVAGLIDKKTGTRELTKLGGLYKHMPITFIISILALLSMAGLPPMLGFMGKELIYEAKVQSPGIASLVLILGVAGNILMVTISMYFLFKVFLGKQKNYPKLPNEKGYLYLLGPGVLTLLSLLLGLSPNLLGNYLVEPALSSIRKQWIDVELKLWHGFNDVLLLSLFTVIMGMIIFIIALNKKHFLAKWRSVNKRIFIIKFTDIFSQLLDDFLNFSANKTKRLQHGYHRFYLLTVIVFTSLFLWFQIYITRNWVFDSQFSLTPLYISGLVVIIACSTLYAVLARSRIATIIAMGVTGYGISLIYLYYSAVDLAITQILVETLIVVMFVLVLQRLPRFATLSSKLTRLRDLIIALVFGSAMAVLALKALHVEFNHPISDMMLENSLIKAYGKNVVNVILVDFRALDTLGEATVLVIAAMGVFVLLKTKKA